MRIAGGTAGVIALALIVYFVTQPSGDSNASGPTANAASSQTSLNPPAPSSVAATPATAGPSSSGSASPTASGGSPTSTSTVNVIKSEVHVAVYNASGVNQRAADVKSALVTGGFSLATVGGTLARADTTKVYYPSTRADSAAAVANALAIPSTDLSLSTAYAGVTVVIGTDWASGNTYPAG